MSSFKWNDGNMLAFLKAYRRQEILWNNKMSGYTNLRLRDQGYSAMLTELNLSKLTIADIKAKIKSVRTRYVAELTKVRSSEKEEDVYEPRLFWFKAADAFLRKVSLPKSSSPQVPDSYEEIISTIDVKQEEIQEELLGPAEYDNLYPMNTSVSNEGDQVSEPQKRHAAAMAMHHVPKKFKKLSNNQKELQNEFDVFCQSLAIQLKKMPLSRALICQERLQQVMTQERLSQLVTMSSQPSSCSSPTSFFSQENLPPNMYNYTTNDTTGNEQIDYTQNDDNITPAMNSIELIYSDDSN